MTIQKGKAATVEYDDIVLHKDSPVLVLAGPGAGKTYMLADRVKRLLDAGIDKDTIRVLAFGREAQQQMYDKLVDRNEPFQLDPKDVPQISTMHSLGYEIVKRKARQVGLRKTGLRVQHDEAIKRLLYRDAALIQGLSLEDAGEAISCKEAGDCNEDDASKRCRVCREYWQIMSKCNRIDFDDQVIFACRILEKHGDLLDEYRRHCSHLLIDEYQDINAAQFKLIRMLSEGSAGGLFVVGDDAQSIYGFRGASPKFILSFGESFPTAVEPPLAYSRRCPEVIMSDAVKILTNYYEDWTGPHVLEYSQVGEEEPAIRQLPSEKAEAKFTAKLAKRFVNDKLQVLVLAPKREFSQLISKELTSRGVAHHCPTNLLPRAVNDRMHVAESFAKWVDDPSNNIATRTAIEELINRGIAKVPGAIRRKNLKSETLKRRDEIESQVASLWSDVDRECDLYTVLRSNSEIPKGLKKVKEALEGLLQAYEDFKGDNRGQFAKLLAVNSGIWVEPSKLVADVLSVMSIIDGSRANGPARVQLMTMKKAKGLEADVVIMIGLEDDVIPNPKADVEEEARLFYVSMTRAKGKLFLLHAFKRPRNISFGQDILNKERSRFLDALDRRSKYTDP